ncbi:MAG: metallophosphoesterase [Xenococcaceae cyanobacterium MO_188.B19]|nr:metallophosphoesterase [Xenococcaceae cyanobacterium MO_188.B19]
MQFVSDPDIAVKIDKMKRRVRWQERVFQEKSIEQTKLVIDDGNTDNPNFSFLVIGDSGCGSHLKHHPQRKIAEMMLQHKQECSFILHTGDVVYQVGSKEYYHPNFINPYKEFLVGGENPKQLQYDRLTFKVPFFLVPGNHDYYDLPLAYGILAQLTWLPRRFLRGRIDLDVGWHGSFEGDAYARAFLDYLIEIKNKTSLEQHLETNYVAKHTGTRCLNYQPGKFTRLPNRYYTFRYGNIDFFALDSNTFNQPLSLPDTAEGMAKRTKLLERKKELAHREQEIQSAMDKLDRNNPEDVEQLDDYYAKLEHIEESKRDIDKQLDINQEITDWEQLEWLKSSLVTSWQDETVQGRIIFLHHPPYVTEKTKWNQGQTLAIRDRLRQVFDNALKSIGELPTGRSIVDIVISGHAHCLEHIRTKDTGDGDSHIDWIVCGGSGHSLRRQRKEGTVLFQNADLDSQPIGESHLYLGRNGSGNEKKRPYSFLRIDVQAGDKDKPKFTVTPYVAERYQQQWNEYAIDSFTL